MKYQKHINIEIGSGWYRCKRVEFIGETAIWELSQTERYSFLEAYRKTPHRQLVMASTDEELRAFVKAWGPLRGTLRHWSGSDPIETYRRERDKLAATVGLLASVGKPERQKDVLFEWIKISAWDVAFETLLAFLRTRFPIPGEYSPGRDRNLEKWLDTATRKQIQAATESLVSSLPSRGSGGGYTVERNAGGSAVRASLDISSLANALDWMVWQDTFQARPFQFCDECRTLFQPEFRHERKFCTVKCAHRKTARESAQRRRNEEKENVTH